MKARPQLVCLALCLLLSCGGKTDDVASGNSGGNSNWLKACDETADCDDEDVCISKVCLSPCDDSQSCEGLSAQAECARVSVVPDTTGTCGTEDAAQYCVLSCEEDADCERMGEGYFCSDGTCAPSCDIAQESEPTETGETEPDAPAPEPEDLPGSAGCLVAIDTTACCLGVVAAEQEQLALETCLVPLEGADLEQVWNGSVGCYGFDICPGASCSSPSERADFSYVATRGADGTCQLGPACDDGTCVGSPCDQREGCKEGFACRPRAVSGPILLDSPCDIPGECYAASESFCDDIYTPVCGCNGVTFDNACYAEPFSIDHEGECEAGEPPSTGADAGTSER